MKRKFKNLALFIVTLTVFSFGGCSGIKANINELRAEDSQSSIVESSGVESNAQDDLIAIQGELRDLQSRLNLSIQNLSVLNFELDELTEKQKDGTDLHNSDIADINVKIAEQVNDLISLREEVEGLNNSCREIRLYLIEEERERIKTCEEIQANLSEIEQSLSEELAEFEILTFDSFSQVSNQISSLSARLTECEESLSKIQALLAQRIEDLETEMDSLKSVHAQRIQALEAINARAGYGWEYVEGYTNVAFSVTNEDITHSGYTSAVKYVSKTDSASYMMIADIYVTGTETVAPEAIKMTLATIGYKWFSGYLPLTFALPSELRPFCQSCPYVEVETYSWLLDTTTNIGKFNGQGIATYSLASTQDDTGRYWHYVRGIGVELDTYNTGDLTIPGKHIVVRMYSDI